MVNTTIGSDVSRDHISPQAWETDTDNNLPSDMAGQEGEGFDDTTFGGPTLTFVGGQQDGTYFRELYASAGEEFDPIAGTGCFGNSIGSSTGRYIQMRDDYFLMRNWGWEDSTTTDTNLRRILDLHSTSSNCTFIACMFKKLNGQSTADSSACVVNASSGNEFYSCIAIGSGGASDAGAVSGFWSGGSGRYYNCVAYGIDNGTTAGSCVGFNMAGAASATVQNCVSMESETSDFTFHASTTHDHNASSDATGDTGLINLTDTDEFTAPGSDDFTILTSGTQTLVDNGTTISSPGENAMDPADDHAATFEIGAYNHTAVGGRRRMMMVT